MTNHKLSKLIKAQQKNYLPPTVLDSPTPAVMITYMQIKRPIETQVYNPICLAIYESKPNFGIPQKYQTRIISI